MNPSATKLPAGVSIEADLTPTAMQNSVILAVSLKRLGNTKKVSNNLIEVDADKDAIRVSKELLNSEELSAIRNHDAEIKKMIRCKCVPSFLQDGMYFVPLESIEEVQVKLEILQAQREELVGAFLGAYPTRKREAYFRLRSTYGETDYPDVKEVAKAFDMYWRYLNLSAPESLQKFDQKLYQQQQREIIAMFDESKGKIAALLRGEARKLVAHLAEKLTEDKEGKRKTFKDTAVDNIRDWLDELRARNVNNDEGLVEIADQIQDLLMGIQPQALRDDDNLREDIRDGFLQIRDQLDTMLEDAPERVITLLDEFDVSEAPVIATSSRKLDQQRTEPRAAPTPSKVIDFEPERNISLLEDD